eukprot:Gb_18899 [translate_table: standard]
MFQMQMKTLYFCVRNTSQRPNSIREADEIEQQPEEVEEGSDAEEIDNNNSHCTPDNRYKDDDRYPRPGILARLFRRPTGGVPKATNTDFRKTTNVDDFYQGVLQDGRQVAIKRRSDQSRYSNHSNQEFLNEWRFMTRFQHRNLVKLVGCSVEGSEASLVYEYLPNGSLNRYLFDREAGRILGWQRRMNIIVGVARGLVYLHEDSEFRIIHRDIKPRNILLDDNFNAKIADFGISILFEMPGEDVEDVEVAGTMGYIAPEVFNLHLTEKADIYSFGVLVLEIVSGRRAVDVDVSEECILLAYWARELHKEGCLHELIDSRLIDEEYLPKEVILRVITIALLCIQEASLRPSMIQVLVMLLSENAIEIRPTNPNSIYFDLSESASFTDSDNSWSSEIEPR